MRIKLAKPDARLFGFLAWTRYSAIVPEGMYQQVSAGREGIGTGPFRLVNFTPGQGTEYVAYANYRKKGLPYLNQLSLPTMPDEQARIAALRAGAIDGATLSPDGARTFQGNSNFTVLRGLTAAFRELQMTQKIGERTSRGTTRASGRRSTSRSTGRRSSTASTTGSASTRGTCRRGTGRGR